MALNFAGRRFWLNSKNNFYQQCRSGYIVLLPEINPDLPDQNPLFKGGYPDVENVDAEKCVNTLGKYLLDFEHSVREVENDLVANGSPNEGKRLDVFEAVVDRLEDSVAPLETTWGFLKTLYIAKNDIMPSDKYLSLHERARRSRTLKYNARHIYNAFKKCDVTKLPEEEHRIVSKFLVEGKLNGLDLSGEDRVLFSETTRKLMTEKDKFVTRVKIDSKRFQHVISDPKVTEQFPLDLKKSLLVNSNSNPDKGPWMASLSRVTYPLLMEFCPDRDLRWNAWIAKRQVASTFSPDAEYNNSNTLEQIRSLRRDLAKVLGYDSYTRMSLETKMFNDLEKLQTLLRHILEKARELQYQEIYELQNFAEERGFEGNLQLWDVPYWARIQKMHKYGWNDKNMVEYFPLEKVFNGILEICSEKFNLKFQEALEVKTWHPDVKFINIYEGEASRPVAGFYFDPFSREGKLRTPEAVGNLIGIRSSARVYGPARPLAALVFNFTPPTSSMPSLLSFHAVESLMMKFGQTLQHLLSTVNYTEVSGLSNIEWDAVDIVSNVMSLWLNDENVIKKISGHYKTGAPLPVADVAGARSHLCGFKLCDELYNVSLDLKLHSTKDFWLSIVKSEWPKHYAFDYDTNDIHPCSAVDVICGPLAGGYFSNIVSKVMAADLYSTFSSADADDHGIGQRFRDTFLAFGGSCHPTEVFRRFNGRDPCPNAFLSLLNLSSDIETPQTK